MKKLFCLLFITCVFYQTCFAWSFFNWGWRPPVITDNTDNKIKELKNDVTGVKKLIGNLDLRVSAIDSKVTGIEDEVVKISLDVSKIIQDFNQITNEFQDIKIAQKATYVELPEIMNLTSIPFTANGKYIGEIIGKYGYNKIEYCGDSIPVACITVDINGFYPVQIRGDGTIELNVFTFFDQPDCKGNAYVSSEAKEYLVSGEGIKTIKYITPSLKGSLFDVNGELYYHTKDSPIIKTTWGNRKSFLFYSPDESPQQPFKGYTGYGRCYNSEPNVNDYAIYVYKLLPNDPAVTGIDEYPFTNILVDGRPFIDLSQVPMIGAE